MTQTFDLGDTTYFFPLMEQTDRRLGFCNPEHDGFAAVAFSRKGGKPERRFDEEGAPLCDAGLAMVHQFSYNDHTTAIIPYRRAKCVCPLLHPQSNGQSCPIAHKNWPKGVCNGAKMVLPQFDVVGELHLSIYILYCTGEQRPRWSTSQRATCATD